MKMQEVKPGWMHFIPETEKDRDIVNPLLRAKGVKECDLGKYILSLRIEEDESEDEGSKDIVEEPECVVKPPKPKKDVQAEPTKPKNGLLELMEMIQNGEVVPDNKQVPFYDDNGRPLHFVKPKQDRKLHK